MSKVPTTLTVKLPPALRTSTARLVTQAQALEVTDDARAEEAGTLLQSFKAGFTALEAVFEPIRTAAHRLHKLVCEQQRQLEGPAREAEATLRGRLSAYRTTQRRLLEQAAAAAHREQQAAEAAHREQLAATFEEAGDPGAAADIRNEPTPLIPIAAPSAPTLPAGVTERQRWAFTITAIGKLPRQYLLPNEALIRDVVRRMGPEATRLIPGIAVHAETTMVVRSVG